MKKTFKPLLATVVTVSAAMGPMSTLTQLKSAGVEVEALGRYCTVSGEIFLLRPR